VITADNTSTACVVCGVGDTGQCVITELLKHGFAVTALDIDQDALNTVKDLSDNIVLIQGNCLIDNVLKKAGLSDAQVLFCILPDDRSNVYLSLSARRINPELEIYSLASDISAERKLKLVGAKRTVSQDSAEGLRISNEMIRPNVVRFLEKIVYAKECTEGYLSIEIENGCPSAGWTFKKLRLHRNTGVVIIAVRRKDGSYVYSPSGDFRLAENDNLICFGTEDDGKVIKELLWGQNTVRKGKWGKFTRILRR
jgi:voltage-gated potassium channel